MSPVSACIPGQGALSWGLIRCPALHFRCFFRVFTCSVPSDGCCSILSLQKQSRTPDRIQRQPNKHLHHPYMAESKNRIPNANLIISTEDALCFPALEDTIEFGTSCMCCTRRRHFRTLVMRVSDRHPVSLVENRATGFSKQHATVEKTLPRGEKESAARTLFPDATAFEQQPSLRLQRLTRSDVNALR